MLNLPDVQGYASNDLWEPHPTKPGFWRMYVPAIIVSFAAVDIIISVGRLDDVLVLASGLNAVPGPLETVIMSSPAVNGVVIFGRGRNQVGVLVEPAPGAVVDDLGKFRNRIW